jgi:hypothetical protein
MHVRPFEEQDKRVDEDDVADESLARLGLVGVSDTLLLLLIRVGFGLELWLLTPDLATEQVVCELSYLVGRLGDDQHGMHSDFKEV